MDEKVEPKMSVEEIETKSSQIVCSRKQSQTSQTSNVFPEIQPLDDELSDIWSETRDNLASKSSVIAYICASKWSDLCIDMSADDHRLQEMIEAPKTFELYCLTRDGVNNEFVDSGSSQDKFRITPEGLDMLNDSLGLPVSFIMAIARPWLLQSAIFCPLKTFSLLENGSWEYWSMIPVRVSVLSEDGNDVQSRMRYQMDPQSPVHLPLIKRDIRGLDIGVFVRSYPGRKSQVVIASLLPVRLADRIWDPLNRIKKAISIREDRSADSDILFVLLAILKAAAEWWHVVLESYSAELIEQESRIHENSKGGISWIQNRMKETNLQLHSIDAHIHRAALSLDHLSQIIDNLQKWQPDMDPTEGGARSRIGLEHIAAQVSLYVARARELKGRNSILINLLSNMAIQHNSELTIQQTESMRRDSVAMKTIATVTMFFLPGTSVAAVFAMPVFSTFDYLKSPDVLWIWALLTSGFTVISFCIYWIRSRHSQAKAPRTDPEKG